MFRTVRINVTQNHFDWAKIPGVIRIFKYWLAKGFRSANPQRLLRNKSFWRVVAVTTSGQASKVHIGLADP
jgi:hypothetical protein